MRRILTPSDMQQQPFGSATRDKCEIDGAAVRRLLRRVLSKACNTCPWYEVRGRDQTNTSARERAARADARLSGPTVTVAAAKAAAGHKCAKQGRAPRGLGGVTHACATKPLLRYNALLGPAVVAAMAERRQHDVATSARDNKGTCKVKAKPANMGTRLHLPSSNTGLRARARAHTRAVHRGEK